MAGGVGQLEDQIGPGKRMALGEPAGPAREKNGAA
jgi:hypothetical protein